MKKQTQNETGSPPLDNDWTQALCEIAEQLRIANRLQVIALEALLDKKIQQGGFDDHTN